MTDLCLLLTPEDASPRSTAALELEPDIKNLTDDLLSLNYSILEDIKDWGWGWGWGSD
jgi:hypothetical protein